MPVTSLQYIHTLKQVVKHREYYWRRIFSKNRAYFYIRDVLQVQYTPKGAGLNFFLIDKHTVGFRSLVSRAVAALKWPKQLAAAEAVASIANRDALMCLVSEGETIVAYEWFTPGMDYLPWLDACVHLEDGEIYEHGAFVRESHRRRGIFKMMKAWSYEQLKERGFRRIVNAIVSWNKPSIRTNDYFEFRMIGQVNYGYFAGCRYFVTTVPVGRLSYVGKLVFRLPRLRRETAYV